MSLNGLESQEVQGAYNAAIAEAAGWFLLKYTTRDAVDLLAQGRAGVSEARNAISSYSEKSPLYGLLMYRRRRILIKFVPEGTSRLLQVRTNVHLQDVLEKYSPYETLLEITSADALSDTSLANSFPMHTAAASPSPSGGRLDEIHEDEDEEPGQAKEQSSGTASSGRLLSAQRHKTSRRADSLASRAERADRLATILNNARRVSTPTEITPLAAILNSPATTTTTPSTVREEEIHVSPDSAPPAATANETLSESRDAPATSTINNLPSLPSPAIEEPSRSSADEFPTTRTTTDVPAPSANPALEKVSEPVRMSEDTVATSIDRPSYPDRTSSMSSRPFSLDEDPYDLSKYDELFKPKVKLGPRPVATTEQTKRAARVSAVPASFKSSMKKSDTSRPTSKASMAPPSTMRTTPSPLPSPALTLPAHIAPPIPPSPDYDPRPVSRSSVKSTASHRSQGMTPDKLRLMKAMEFRKRQMRKSQQQSGEIEPMIDEEAPSVPQVPTAAIAREESNQTPTESTEQEQPKDSQRGTADSRHHAQSSKADSGIEMHYDQADEKPSEMDEIAEDEDGATPQDEKPQATGLEHSSEKLKAEKEHADSVVEREEHNDERPLGPVPQLAEEPAVEGASGEDSATISSSSVGEEHTMDQSWLNISVEDVKEEQRFDSHDDSVSPMSSEASTAQPDAAEPAVARHIGVPTITMEAASRPVTSDGQADTGAIHSGAATVGSHATSEVDLTDDRSSRPDSDELAKQKRRGVVEPLDVDSSRNSTISDFSSDDEFLEELHSATVEEARPVQVARSPTTPLNGGFSWSNQQNIDDSISVKSVSIYRTSSFQKRLEDGEQISPQLSPQPTRSISVVSRTSPTPPPEKMDLASKMARNVSSGISRRIQALNQSTSKETSPSGYSAQSHPLTPEASPILQQDHKERKVIRKILSGRRLSSKFANSPSREGTPTLDNIPVWSVQHDPTTNNPSVSVTTRIVRPKQEADSETSLFQLGFASREEAASQSLPELPRPITISSAQSAGSTPPVSPATTGSGDYRTLHSAASSRFNRRKKTSTTPEDTASKSSRRSSSAMSYTEENAPSIPKEGSRTSRFFKRVSTLGGPKNRKSMAPSVTSSSSGHGVIHEGAVPDKSDMPPAVVIGDLNVQFPDSLLWKRRIVSIDELGSLLFSPTQGSIRSSNLHMSIPSTPIMATHQDINARGIISARRFPLADFKTPHAPDLEIQELPHSVVLEFPDGTTLQLACEDAMTQRQVLHLLKSYWKSWGAVA